MRKVVESSIPASLIVEVLHTHNQSNVISAAITLNNHIKHIIPDVYCESVACVVVQKVYNVASIGETRVDTIEQLQAASKTLQETSEFVIWKHPQIGVGPYNNELLTFIKPEIFLEKHHDSISESMNLIGSKLQQYDAYLHGILLVPGPMLERHGIMSRHYGYINVLSQRASEILTLEDKKLIFERLGLASSIPIFGGHEYLDANNDIDAHSLDNLWFTKKSIKFRSGLYAQWYERHNGPFVLVNGFHPAQISHFTDRSRKILVGIVHSNTDWDVLRNEMIGDTFPEKANRNSIRGSLFADPQKYGFDTVGIANNGIHLSAGPFEAAFEIDNFFGRLTKFDIEETHPQVIQQLIERGIPASTALSVIDNGNIAVGNEIQDVFSLTEHMNSQDAIHIVAQGLGMS